MKWDPIWDDLRGDDDDGIPSGIPVSSENC